MSRNRVAIAVMAIALGVVVGFHTARAQELEISVSPSPVGSGARAAGMADAFVAIADDATAASWNPAGLVQLEAPEISIVGAYNGIIEEFSADYHPEVDSRNSESNFDLNFMSVTYPLPFLILNRNAVVGLYYQHKYDFSRKFRLERNTANTFSNGIILNQFFDMDFRQEGSLSAITPAFAIELTHRLSVGVGLNVWRSSFLAKNGWEQNRLDTTFALSAGNYALTRTVRREKYSDVHGESVTLGALWNITDRWSLGARYDSSWTAKSDFELVRSTVQFNLFPPTLTPFMFDPRVVKEPRKLRFPATLAVGAACRVNDRLTISGDVSRTNWNDFWFKGRDGNRRSLVNAANFDDVLFPPRFEPTYTVRLGAEYVFVPKQPEETLDRLWTLRGGLFYDQEPATHEPDNFWGLALGVGLLAKQRVNIDIAYQLRYGKNVNSDFIRGISGFDEEVFQNRVLLSTVIYF